MMDTFDVFNLPKWMKWIVTDWRETTPGYFYFRGFILGLCIAYLIHPLF